MVWLRIVATGAALLYLNNQLVDPALEISKAIKGSLCNGDRDFVSTINKASGIPMLSKSMPFDLEYSTNLYKSTIWDYAFRDGALPLNEQKYEMVDHWETLRSISEGSIEHSANLLRCVDHLDQKAVLRMYQDKDLTFRAMTERMRLLVSNASLSSCNDIDQELCNDPTNVQLRAACPSRCGCNMAWQGIMWATAAYGCPASCDSHFFESLEKVPSWSAPLTQWAMQCLDAPIDVLRSIRGWNMYLKGTKFALIRKGADAALVNSTLANLREGGCDAVLHARRVINLVVPNVGGIGRAVCAFCPQACECNVRSTTEIGCPHSCFQKIADGEMYMIRKAANGFTDPALGTMTTNEILEFYHKLMNGRELTPPLEWILQQAMNASVNTSVNRRTAESAALPSGISSRR